MSDLISRSALLEKAYKCVTATAELCVVDSYAVEAAPAVDAVPVVHGRWKRILRGNYECSLCGCIPYYAGNIYTLRYCPHCGAKMDGGEDDV